jgi:O-antigen/teichoic acid export membrane protein
MTTRDAASPESTGERDSKGEGAATAAFKLAEVASRLLFLLMALLLLDSRGAGQFGLLNTLIAIFTLVVGFERWGVLWRRLANVGADECGAIIATAIRFFQFNYLIWAPVFVAVSLLWIRLTPLQTLLGLGIAICEQLTAGAYWLATVQGRFRWLVLVTAAKNGALLLGIVTVVLWSSQPIQLSMVLEIWALAGLGTILIFVRLHRGDHSAKLRLAPAELRSIVVQYRESTAHFLTGFAAFVSGQIDRIVIGAAVGLAVTGVYFKNVFLAASVYSAVTILLHNRAVPRLYREVTNQRFSGALSIARVETTRAFAIYGLVVIALQVLVRTPGLNAMLATYSVSTAHLTGLIVAFFFRTMADFNCSILNAAGHEKVVLTVHASSVSLSALLVFFLSRSFGISGTVGAMVVGCATLCLLSMALRIRALNRQSASPNLE